MASPQSVIKNFMQSLDNTSLQGTAALDEAVSAVSNFSSWQQLKDTMVKDCAAYNGNGTAFLSDACNIVLNNSDTGAITGSDAGGSVTKTAESVVAESGSWSYPTDSTTTINGLTVVWPEESSLSESERWVIGGLNSWWIRGALDLIQESYGISFNDSDATVKTLKINLVNRSTSTSASTSSSESKQKTTDLTLNINMNFFDGMDQSNENGYSSKTATYFDRTIAHELTHAVMAANIDYFFDLPTVFSEGIAETTHGIDDKRQSAIESLSTNSSSLSSALSGSSSAASNYASGYMIMRYLAKQASENRDPSADIISSSSDSTTDNSTSSTSSENNTTNTSNNGFAAFENGNSGTSSSDSSNNSSSSSNGFSIFENSYTASVSDNTLNVSGNMPSDVWLNGENAFTGETADEYKNDSVTKIDASGMNTRHVLAGNDNNNEIISGTAGGDLWGGWSSSDDVLIGGGDWDIFWYTPNAGNDRMENVADNDLVALFGITLDNVDSIEDVDNSITVKFNNGGSVQVNSISDQSNFQLGDSSKWRYTHSTQSWEQVE